MLPKLVWLALEKSFFSEVPNSSLSPFWLWSLIQPLLRTMEKTETLEMREKSRLLPIDFRSFFGRARAN
jgi:hypothetical protein